MNKAWFSFVPWHLAGSSLTNGASPVGRQQRFPAVVLFADVSGFTAISEALGAAGKCGTEELTDILNRYFEPMVALIQSYGGIIGKFGGDAMTVIFPYAPDASSQAGLDPGPVVARRALHCALEMQARMGTYLDLPTSAGPFGLAMKAGLAYGPVYCTTLGEPHSRLEYIIAGPPLDRSAEAEHHAAKGEVVAANNLLALTGDVTLGEARLAESGLGFHQVIGVPASDTPDMPTPLPPLPDGLDYLEPILAAFLHPSLAERVRSNQLEFINEHRKVTVLFVSFSGFDYENDPLVGERLQSYITQVIHTVRRYDGYLNKVDMGDKGSKYIVLFGAPIGHEDDAARALHCALDLRLIPGAQVRIGVNGGFVFCGQIGAPDRREYTVMGDAVNLAARLMQAAAPGQTLVGAQVKRHIKSGFAWDPPLQFKVKGKAQPVEVFPLLNVQSASALGLQEPRYNLPMVGRQAELDLFAQKLDVVQAGQGQIIGITGEAGMGKSRLVAEMIRLALARGLTALGGECLSHGTHTSYLVWQPIWHNFFELQESQTPEEKIAQLEASLSSLDPSFTDRLPLLAPALNLPIPDNDLTRPLSARLRKEALEGLLLDCLRQRAQHTPLLVIIESYHWVDPLSDDLLEVICRSSLDLPLLVLVVYRPPEDENTPARLGYLPHFTEIHLADFSPSETEELVRLKLAHLYGFHQTPPAGLVERIAERAQGNPFYVDEMLNLLHDRGLDPADPQGIRNIELPDSLTSLIISRIDQLAEHAKTTLKVASVIGRLFRARWLGGVYPELGTDQAVIADLDQLSRLEITPLDRTDPELEYLFKHIVTRDVAYESLSLATRQTLHEQVGFYIERSYPHKLDQFTDWLAYHFGLSQNQGKQRQYFWQAGVAAQAKYSNEAAVQYFQRLLPLVTGADKIPVLLKLHELFHLTGAWDQALEQAQAALAWAQHINDLQQIALCKKAVGAVRSRQGAFGESIQELKQALSMFEQLADRKNQCDTLREIGIAFFNQSDYPNALQYFDLCRKTAEEIRDQSSLFRSIGNIGNVYQVQCDYELALTYHEQGRRIALEIGDRLGAGIADGNIGGIYLEQGRYTEAFDSFLQYWRLATEIGFKLGTSIAIGNLGFVYLDCGEYNPALACYAINLKIAAEIGDQLGVSIALWKIALVWKAQGLDTGADRVLDQAIRIGRELDTTYELCEYLYTHADFLAGAGKLDKAQAANADALQMATDVEREDIIFRSQVLDVRLAYLLSHIPLEAALQKLQALHTDDLGEEEQAILHYEAWRLDRQQDPARQSAAALYCNLFTRTPNIQFQQRYLELTGESLPPAPPLPPLPEVVTHDAPNLEALLAQVEAALTVH